MTLNIEFSFDKDTYRHFINGQNAVMHCHHYMSLTTALAEQFASAGGPALLAESAEDSIRPLLDEYFSKESITDVEQRLQVGAELYAFLGMGKMTVAGGADGAGEVTLHRSHVDEGWVQKFGQADHPLNHFTCGYLAAVFGAAHGKPARSFKVSEEESMAAGAPQGRFAVQAA
jgi:hypothetical protein